MDGGTSAVGAGGERGAIPGNVPSAAAPLVVSMNTLRSRVPSLALAATASVAFGAAVRAQDLPPLSLVLQPTWKEEPLEEGENAALMGYLQLRSEASASAAGAWIVPVLDLHCTNPAFFSRDGAPSWVWALEESECTIAGLLNTTSAWNSPYLTESIFGYVDDGLRLDTAVGNPASPTFADPLYSNGGQSISQIYCERPGTGWELDDNGTHFNTDKIFQHAAWQRLVAEPEFLGMPPGTLFENRTWATVLEGWPALTIQMIGLRATGVEPSSVPGIGGGNVQGLGDYPNATPKLTRAPQRTITYVGTGNTATLQFWPEHEGTKFPVYATTPGGFVAIPASGYIPRMQVALVRSTDGLRQEINLRWANFGAVGIPVPDNMPLGNWDVVAYRYRESSEPASPWANWKVVPWGRRPRLMVQ
jgi:hypothetical protein